MKLRPELDVQFDSCCLEVVSQSSLTNASSSSCSILGHGRSELESQVKFHIFSLYHIIVAQKTQQKLKWACQERTNSQQFTFWVLCPLSGQDPCFDSLSGCNAKCGYKRMKVDRSTAASLPKTALNAKSAKSRRSWPFLIHVSVGKNLW